MNASAFVSTVLDGDTIRLQTGEKVRLLSINSPEEGQPYYEDAKNRLKELIEGKTVTLEADLVDKDQYGRLLRYIHYNGTLINAVMLREGYATLYIIHPNTKYAREFEAAEEEARRAQHGLWKPSSGTNSTCLVILSFHWNAAGNDCANLNDEYLTFKNTCTTTITMTGWTVQDEANHVYQFPPFQLAGGATVTLYTGPGKNTATALYWNSTGHTCNAIWNNEGDTLYLRDSTGRLVLSYSYTGFT